MADRIENYWGTRILKSFSCDQNSYITIHQKTNAEIHTDMFLTLTNQEEFVNPFTNETETGSNQWKYRWVNAGGEAIYTDDASYDPRTDIRLNRSDYKRTPVRERFPKK